MSPVTRKRSTYEAATELPLQALVDERLIPIGSAPVQPSGTGAWTGPFRGLRHGHGLDFDDLRPYAEGDDMRHIDWKVSARRNLTHTRLYREEKDHVLSVGLDLRLVMFNGSSTLRAVTAGRLAARLLWHASARGSRVRLLVLSDTGIRSTRARAGENGALDACGLISEVFEQSRERIARSATANLSSVTRAPATSDTSRNPPEDPPEAPQTLDTFLSFLVRQGRQLGSLILLSGMDREGAQFDEQLASLAGSRPVAAVLLDDALLLQGLPPGRYAWRSEYGVRQVTLNPRQAQSLREKLAQQRRQLIDRFQTGRVPLCATSDGTDNTILALQQAGFLP